MMYCVEQLQFFNSFNISKSWHLFRTLFFSDDCFCCKETRKAGELHEWQHSGSRGDIIIGSKGHYTFVILRQHMIDLKWMILVSKCQLGTYQLQAKSFVPVPIHHPFLSTSIFDLTSSVLVHKMHWQHKSRLLRLRRRSSWSKSLASSGDVCLFVMFFVPSMLFL